MATNTNDRRRWHRRRQRVEIAHVPINILVESKVVTHGRSSALHSTPSNAAYVFGSTIAPPRLSRYTVATLTPTWSAISRNVKPAARARRIAVRAGTSSAGTRRGRSASRRSFRRYAWQGWQMQFSEWALIGLDRPRSVAFHVSSTSLGRNVDQRVERPKRPEKTAWFGFARLLGTDWHVHSLRCPPAADCPLEDEVQHEARRGLISLLPRRASASLRRTGRGS
jgi:hypothetical protein